MTHVKNKLYGAEEKIVKLVVDKLNGYGNSSKELIQKQNELFYLLCFLDIDSKLSLYDSISPNEPGDFLLVENEKKVLIEVTECFGNESSYAYMRNRLNELFNRKKKINKNFMFTIEEVIEKIRILISDKNYKDYNKNCEYDEVILLIVTGEYTGCSSTGNWIIKYLDSCEIRKSNYKVYILDYFASGRDGNPIIIKDVINEIDSFKSYFNYTKSFK